MLLSVAVVLPAAPQSPRPSRPLVAAPSPPPPRRELGEFDLWCKMSTLELGTRIPLIIRTPWIPSSVGAVTPALAEAVDLFPTLVELAGLPPPTGAAAAHLGGVSLVPVLHVPAGVVVKEEPGASGTTSGRCWPREAASRADRAISP